MRKLTIPSNLAEMAGKERHRDLREWTRTLPELVGELAERWTLRVGEPFQPGGYCSWVAPGRNLRGEDVVLKVEWSHTEAAHEADALRCWSGSGAVRLYAADAFDDTIALLLERCVPGTQLGRSAPEVAQDIVVAGLLRRLWRHPPPGHPFPPLQAMCDAWAAEFEEEFATSSDGVDPGLAREGAAMLRALPRTADRAVLLCTDLHAGNILAAQREPWLVVDPKPYVGDPACDPVQHMLNCMDRLRADPLGLAKRMADLLDLDAERVGLWLFARCVQESVGNPLMAEIAACIAP